MSKGDWITEFYYRFTQSCWSMHLHFCNICTVE